MDKSKMMMGIIIALLVLLLGSVVGVTIFLIGLVGDDNGEDWHDPIPPPPITITLMDLYQFDLGTERILTNTATDPGGTAAGIVQTDVFLGLNNTEEAEGLDELIVQLSERIGFARNIVISVFQSRTYEQMRTPEGQAATKEEIRLLMQEAFATNLIVSVGFSNWLLTRR